MRTRLGMLVPLVVLAAASTAPAQQPFLIPSNGNTTNVPSPSTSPGVSSVFYNTMVNKQSTNNMMFVPSLSTFTPFTQMVPSFQRIQNLMQRPSANGPTSPQSFTYTPRPRPTSTTSTSSWRWPWSQ